MNNDILTHHLGWFDWNTQEDFLERIGHETIADISNWPFKNIQNRISLGSTRQHLFYRFIERL